MCDDGEAYCRLCAEPTTKETLISPDEDVGINSKIATKLLWINVDISTTDTLPKSICFSCFDLLERTWSFLHNVRTAQTKLNEIFLQKDDKENSCIEVKTVPIDDGQPVNVDWEDFEDLKREVKPEILGEELQIVTVDPNSLLNLSTVKIERDSDEDILQGSDGFNSTDSDTPLYLAVKKKKAKKKKKLRYNSDLDAENDTKETKCCPLTWDDYMCRCADCDAQCKNVMSLRLHSLQIHNRCCTFKCSDCGKVISNYKSFVNHVRSHTKLLRYCCEFCNKRFTMAPFLKKHRNTFHANAFLTTCQNCGANFETEEQLQDHMIIYTKNYRKRALKCEKVEYELKCEHCQKEFKSRSNLQQHKLVHTDRSRDFSCHVCGKMFFTKGTLSTHMMTHDETKPFKCEFCPMAFRARGNLQSHISLHSGAKPFVCEQCGKSFRVKRHLKSHSIVHTDLMPYVCNFCNKTFRFKTRLNLHLRQHTGAKPYKCVYCERDFTNGSNFKKHMKRRHSIDTSRKKYNNIVGNEPSMEGSDGDVETNQT